MLKNLLFLFSLTLIVRESLCDSETLTSVSAFIPKSERERWIVSMDCIPNISKKTLYTVRWFKDGHEFYKYVDKEPEGENTSDRTIGLDVDLVLSDKSNIFIRNVSLAAAGVYRCEVTTNAPSSKTVSSQERKLEITPYTGSRGISMDLLTEKPKTGDIVKMRCNYVLGDGNALQTVNWYKDGKLFYTYAPGSSRTQEVEGIDVQLYGEDKIVLKVMNDKTGGKYKCEVKGSGSYGQHSMEHTLVIKK